MKTNLNYKLLIILLIISQVLTSCEDIIEIDLPNDKMNREHVYADIVTTKSALNYLYSRLRDTPILNFNTSGTSSTMSLYTDELTYHGNNVLLAYTNDIDPINLGNTAQWWDGAYKDIYAINAFIEGVTKSTYLKQSDKDQLLGEAYTLRAVFYLTLTKIYGNIPYTTTTDYTKNTFIEKTNYTKVLSLIENDLLLANSLLDYTYRNTERIYVNKAISDLLLSENYLLQKKYVLAQTYAENIINNPLYKLENDIDNTFKKYSKSTLLQISPVTLPFTTQHAFNYLFTQNPTSSLNPILYNSLSANDLRKTKWIKSFPLNGTIYYQPYKYKNTVNNTEEYGVFYRLEEAYFFLAEALAYQEKVPEATNWLNQIRNKRGLPDLSTSLAKDTFIDELLVEANKEFFTEGGHRFFDLKRNGKIQNLSNSKPTWKPHNDLFPIPEKQTLINKNLLPNNPSY
ncbi:RagB/SusD family nutrient uptake outer membrane protein [Myroides sp. LJL116]